MLLCSFPFVVSADDTEVISGSYLFVCDGANKAVIGDKTFSPTSKDFSFNVILNVNGCDYTHNTVFLNGAELCALVNGENIIEVDASLLSDSENRLMIRLDASNKGHYNDKTVYGSVNLDDMVVASCSFEGLGNVTAPKYVDLLMPIVGQAGYNIVRVDYYGNLSIGDGWNSDTNNGGSTPDVPVSCDYIFETPDFTGMFPVLTTEFSDGKYEVEFYKDDELLGTKNVIIDNTAPVVEFSVKQGSYVPKGYEIGCKLNDLSASTASIILDGKKVSKINTSSLDAGEHSAIVTATDAVGNVSTTALVFNVADQKLCEAMVDLDNDVVTMTSYADGATIYGGNLLTDVKMYHNRLGSFDMRHLRDDDEVRVDFDEKDELITEAVGNTVPYQSFVVNVSGHDDDLLVSYTGETGNGVDIALKAWNYNESRWDELATTPSGISVTFTVDIDTYSYNNSVRINAVPKLISNGSDTLLWNSDTQYYSRFEDLHDFYYTINEYAAEQYINGNIAYCVHTGDLIDQSNAGEEIARYEYGIASKAQDILDKAGVPNGVVSGNHDVFHSDGNYEYYYDYFGEDRYENFDWYGGSLNNNMHHYDLVTIGVYDFVFLYIGNYKETEPDLIAWANAVCQSYPDRNVILCTHEYLYSNGTYCDRAQVIWDEIIVPNENVKMMLCGHDPGAVDTYRQVEGTDRYVLEILADYQYAELGKGPQNIINNITCDGEGFVRLMTFTEAGQLISNTYSPVHDINNYFPSYQDSFVYDLDLIRSNRSIRTSVFTVGTDFAELGEFGKEEINLGDYSCFVARYGENDNDVYSEVYALIEYETAYRAQEDTHDYTVNTSRVSSGGLMYVNENFIRNGDNVPPTDPFIEVGIDLIPDNPNLIKRTSGNTNYTLSVTEEGKLKLTVDDSSLNWVTVSYSVSESVDLSKYNRLYFGVTCDAAVKWNVLINSATAINFSQINYEDFGYVNTVPSDITGTWCGYIDVTEYIKDGRLSSVYFTAATPGATVTFDYMFLASSDGVPVRFITDENIVTAVEYASGASVSAPADPYKFGHTFAGWYSDEALTQAASFPLTVGDSTTNLYAKFVANNEISVEKTFSSKEVSFEKTPVTKIVVLVVCVIMIFSMIFVLSKKASSKKRKGAQK